MKWAADSNIGTVVARYIAAMKHHGMVNTSSPLGAITIINDNAAKIFMKKLFLFKYPMVLGYEIRFTIIDNLSMPIPLTCYERYRYRLLGGSFQSFFNHLPILSRDRDFLCICEQQNTSIFFKEAFNTIDVH